jgi:hypothetical protein
MLTLFHNNEQYPLENSEYYIRELASGLDEAIFTIDIHDPIYAILAEEENVVDRAGQTYKVKQIDAGAHDAKVICQLDIDEWRATLVVNYNSGTKTCYDQINAVKPAGWTVYDRAHIGIGRTLEGDLTPYDVCVQCTEVYSVYVRWDNKRKECTIYPKTLGTPVGAFATRELNLKEINYKGKSNDLITRLYAYGKDGLSFASINGGKPYVDNNTYESRTICGIWRDERYEVAQNLLDDATAKLAKMSRPERTYECSIVDLQATNPELYNNLDFSLFTTATLIDDIKNTSVDYQVVERHIYPYHPEMNEVIFNSEPMKITASVVDIKYQIESPNSTFQQIMDKKAAEATDWMLSGNGYVVAIQSSDGQWKELLFMDTNDISTAQKVLRINENGIGFSTTGASGPYTNAWTINGQLVADFITTGHMLLDRLQGGTVTIGGKATGVYQNGTLKVKDASDNDIASISNTGITFNSNNFKVDNQGKLIAKSATIEGDITVGGSSNANGSITVKNSGGSNIATINNSGFVYGNNKFKVDANGKVTASGVDLTGDIKADSGYFKAGYIGTSGDWEITGDGIHSKNGPTAAIGQNTRGTYVGKDGLCCNGASTHVWISEGAISTDGTIYTSGTVDTEDMLIRDDFEVMEGAASYRGVSGQITWSASGTAHSIIFHKGVITGFS